MKKTWQEKLEDKPHFPEIHKLEKRFPCYNAVYRLEQEHPAVSAAGMNCRKTLSSYQDALRSWRRVIHKMGAEEGDNIILVNPSEVVEIMKQVPEGKLITIVEICKKIAKRHNVKGCCSLTTGIFIMTAANAAEEAHKEGKSLDIPYWCTLKSDGFLNPKYPGGQETHKELLEQEGYKVIQKGKNFWVQDFQKYLV